MALTILRFTFRSYSISNLSSIKLLRSTAVPCLKYNIPFNPFLKHFHITGVTRKRRKTADERKSHRIIEYSPKAKIKDNVVEIWKNITIRELAAAMGKDTDHIFEVLLHVDNSSEYSEETSVLDNPQIVYDIIKKSGMRYKIIAKPSSDTKVKDKTDEYIDVKRRPPCDPKLLVPRCPVVTIMGHVDHGKTTLLDSLRNTCVVASEFGGITQHIGAFSVQLKSGEKITFLDTPGHAAFSAMRARGANVTDLVVLVVAADDGVMEQTIESIRMAKQANVPIIVAINKIDKPEADIERTKKMLLQNGIVLEDFGGDVQTVPVSALKKTNLDQLTEAIVLQAEIMGLKADPKGLVEGVIVESKTDAYRGKLSTSVIQRGTLRKGSVLVAGLAWAKVRGMFDHDGNSILEAPPSTPVEILGWRELPSAGDEMLEVENEKRAHEIVKYREAKKIKEKQLADAVVVDEKIAEHLATYHAQLEKRRKLGRFRVKPDGPREKEIKDEGGPPKVSVVIKGDVDGSVEAILDVLETYDDNSRCKLDVVHYGVGNVTENDIELAESFNAIIYEFNVDCPTKITTLAKQKNVQIKPFNVIYKLVDDLKSEISQKLPLKQEEELIGEANVLQQFIITEGKKKTPVAGCRCIKGMLKKSALYRVVRNNETIHEGPLESMRHLKKEVDTVKKDVECGLQLHDKTVEFKPGDVIICYKLNDVPQHTDWDPGF